MSPDYRQSHDNPGHAEWYAEMYEDGYYRHIWEYVERPLLEQTISRTMAGRRAPLLVDLACGTGRITRAAAPLVGHAVGIDVSEAMLEIARNGANNAQNIKFVRADIHTLLIDDNPPVDSGSVDCITAFRFFTNADPEVRELAAAAAFKLLNPSGVFITNIHTNPQSPVGWFYRAERRVRDALGRPRIPFKEVFAPSDLIPILERAGFTDIEVTYYAALPGLPRLWRHMNAKQVTEAERRFSGRTWNQCALLVAHKR